MTNNLYKVLPGGMTAKKVNPHMANTIDCVLFNRSNYPVDLTEQMEEGKVFEGKAYDQYIDIMQRFECWHDCDDDHTKHWAEVNDLRTRTVVKPIQPVKETDPFAWNKAIQEMGEAKTFEAVDANKGVPEVKIYKTQLKAMGLRPDLIEPVANLMQIAFNYGRQQSQSIDTIVGFVLEWVAGKVDKSNFYSNGNDILNMKADIIKELNTKHTGNGK